MANEWAIYKWSEFLGVNGTGIDMTVADIKSRLDFKYLQKKYEIEEDADKNKDILFTTKQTGKILLIDDEWNKGWSDILGTLFQDTSDIEFTTYKRIKKDANQEILIPMIKGEVRQYKPDVVILDLRLVVSDHEDNVDLDSLTGIQLVKKIKEINPGIQIIMLTATSRSVVLEKLYSYGILGYIKKEHPNDRFISTAENINKIVRLVDQGLEKSYLKEIWSIQNKLINLNMIKNAEEERNNLNNNIRRNAITLEELQGNRLSEESEKLIELRSTIELLYEVLDSNLHKKFSFAVLTIYKCLEIIADYYIREESKVEIKKEASGKEKKKQISYAVWKHNGEKISNSIITSVSNKLSNIFKIIIDDNRDTNQDKKKIVCTRNAIIHPDTIKPNCEKEVIAEKDLNQKYILIWFRMLYTIMKGMDNNLRARQV